MVHNFTAGLYSRKLKKGAVPAMIMILLLAVTHGFAQNKKVQKPPLLPVTVNRGGELTYQSDSLSNRVIDFSYCGYKSSDEPIPDDLPVKVSVPVTKGDATLRIQSALDYVAGLPPGKGGIKGVVLLEKGRYPIRGTLKMNASGVVLRGSGMGDDGTMLEAEGTQRATLIIIGGKKDSMNGTAVKIADNYIPVNSFKVHVADASAFKAGDKVVICRPSTEGWINALGTRTFGGGLSALGWKPGERNLYWDRVVTAVSGDAIQLDAPLTTALDVKYGGGTISTYQWKGRISQVGVENLSCVSAFDSSNPKDEDHRWMAITMDNIEDAWIRRIIFKHFCGSAVDVLSGGSKITVQDCKSLAPVSEIGGQRRDAFLTSGQQTLFQRLYSEEGYHDFSVGFCAAGPNAFVQCQAENSFSYSGSADSWASGVLFDVVRVDGQELGFKNLGQDEQGAGWNAANSVLWNCYAAKVDCYQPPTAENYAFGTWAQFSGDGFWAESNNWITPRSLFYAQLKQRLGHPVDGQAGLMPAESEASSSPTVAQAAALTAEAYKPALTMDIWINELAQMNPIISDGRGVKTIDRIGIEKRAAAIKGPDMQVKNGWLQRDETLLTGKRSLVPWWSGTVKPDYLKLAKPAITRFVPGRTGTGLTDDLDSVTSRMVRRHIEVMEQNYGLWYDRRRDDHERVKRMDGDVWPPFYELPFARSGKGIAWDGLSKYDLTRYNKFYWSRLKQFADLADAKGLVLIHHNYFQHNIIEAGAHYADFPWRPVNNINHTGFPEPVHFAADKRLFMAEQFYDETNPVRRKLHTAFIRQCLDNFKDNHSVIQFICEEYTGPLHFAQFWIDVIKKWEKDNAQKELIGLSTTKDVQDAILSDPARAAAVNVIDIRYWYYQSDGTAYAPAGGQSLAPRQQERQFKPKKTSFEQIYRAVRQYRDKYPDKAVMYSADDYESMGWAVFIAGGSLPALPPGLPVSFLKAATRMRPVTLAGQRQGQWALAGPESMIVYNSVNQPVSISEKQVPIKPGHHYTIQWIDPADGHLLDSVPYHSGQQVMTLQYKDPGHHGPIVLWLRES